MKITIELPEYAVVMLERDADDRGTTRDAEVRRILLAHADGLISTRWYHVKARDCSKCGCDNYAPLGCQQSNATPLRCEKCGARLSTRDRIDVIGRDGKRLQGDEKAAWYRKTERFLSTLEEMRLEAGFLPPAPARPLRETFAAFLNSDKPGRKSQKAVAS